MGRVTGVIGCESVLLGEPTARGDLVTDALPFGRLWYGQPNAVSNATGYAIPDLLHFVTAESPDPTR